MKCRQLLVLFLTNSISKSIGVTYAMHPNTMAVKISYKPIPGIRDEPGKLSGLAKTLTTIADLFAKFEALTDPQMQNDLRNRGIWTKKDTFSMFYGEHNHNGAIWALFLMFKNVVVGVMLTSCNAVLCSVPCPCGSGESSCSLGTFANSTTAVTGGFCEHVVPGAPLLGLSGKVWTIFVIYLIEFLVLAFFSPDGDLFNGYKSALQQMHQSIVMLVAALIATENIEAESGAKVLITLATIQVALAMPEQILGVLKSMILKSGSKQGPPDFPMTNFEMDLKAQLSTGFDKKIDSMKGCLEKVMALKPHMLEGNGRDPTNYYLYTTFIYFTTFLFLRNT